MLPIPNSLPKLQPSTTKSERKKTGKNESGGLGFQESLSGNSVQSTPQVKETKQLEFADYLEEIAPAGKEETKDINQLWKDLPGLERELINTKSPIALENYKQQVKSLLNLILTKNVKYQKISTPIRGTQMKKEYTHVTYFNEKLKTLAEIITDPRNSAFQILKQMDSIRGFLLDIQR